MGFQPRAEMQGRFKEGRHGKCWLCRLPRALKGRGWQGAAFIQYGGNVPRSAKPGMIAATAVNRQTTHRASGGTVAKYVIEPAVALSLAAQNAAIPARHKLLAPSLLRSQVLALLFAQVRRGELSQAEASRRLDYLRRLQIRLLGDRVLQRTAWTMALELGWQDTFVAEYLALTRLQADALVTENSELAAAATPLVAVVSLEHLLRMR
jgi:predicted nucleic acid-binding protein